MWHKLYTITKEYKKQCLTHSLIICHSGGEKEIMAVKSNSKKSEKAHIHITGMTCTTCAATIEKALTETPGVEQANVSFGLREGFH